MVQPVNNAHSSYSRQVEQPQPQKPQPKPQSAEVQDKVTLKRTGDVDHDGDSR